MSRQDGELILSIGISRSGKSNLVKVISENFDRVIAFDPKGEYALQMGFEQCVSPRELLEKAKATKGAGKLAFVADDKKSFEFFCEVAFNFNRESPALIIAEELAAVTSSGKASGSWGRLVNQGLAYEPTILATAQRGSEIDKSILNNATYLNIMQHQTNDDANYIAKKLGVDIDLIPRDPLKFLQWRGGKGVLCSGYVDFAGSPRDGWSDGSPRFFVGGRVKKVNKTRFQGIKYQ